MVSNTKPYIINTKNIFDDFYDYEISITNHVGTKSHDGRPHHTEYLLLKAYIYTKRNLEQSLLLNRYEFY